MIDTDKCANCGTGKISRPRGLCWNCYYLPGVRDQYPPTSACGSRGIGGGTARAAPPSCSTVALPGSAAKIEILALRARLRQELWHPLDRGLMR